MDALILLGIVIVLCFGAVVMFGAPYLPTLKNNIDTALTLTDLKPGQLILELGSGDGRVAKAAAKRGLHVIGYELNPFLVIFSKLSCWRYRSMVVIRWGNFWRLKLPECDAIYTFLLPKYMSKLDRKLQQEITSKTKLVSFAFKIPARRPTRTEKGLFLYEYLPKR